MPFNDNDIKEQLRYSGATQSGVFNQLQWSIDTGKDSTDIISRVISVHEFLHNELNNITGYGFLLQGYAYLSREKSEEKQFYTETLRALVARCKIAHEAYATWVGITVFKKNINDRLPEAALENNEEYSNYYNRAEYLVRNLRSIFLKQQAISASIRFCFQSNCIANYGINNLTRFQFADIKNIEFPDSRFNYLLEQLPENFFSDCILTYINSLSDTNEKLLLSDAFNGNENAGELVKMENNHLALGLMHSVYEQLQELFDSTGSPSLGEQEHLTYFELLLQKLDIIFPFANSKNPLFPNLAPDDYDRSMVLNFENETLLLTDAPLQCVILQPEDIDELTLSGLKKGIGEVPHLFITGRYSKFLENQYEFKYEEDRVWFENLNGPFTAIRFARQINDERVIILIPFQQPLRLIEFLKDVEKDIPILGCVSISAAYHTDWWQLWGDLFADSFTLSCLITDISPLYYIEKVFPKEKSIFYSKIIVEINSIKRTAMVFQVKNEGDVKTLMVAPGSDMYCQVLHHFIKTRYPTFINDISFTPNQAKFIPIILSHILREEHTYYYRSQNINYI